MRRSEGVVLGLRALRKARQPLPHAQLVHAIASAGQYLVPIGLMPHIPHQPVVRRVKNIVQRNGQLHRAEVGRQVAAGLAHRLDQKLAQFIGQTAQLAAFQLPQCLQTPQS